MRRRVGPDNVGVQMNTYDLNWGYLYVDERSVRSLRALLPVSSGYLQARYIADEYSSIKRRGAPGRRWVCTSANKVRSISR